MKQIAVVEDNDEIREVIGLVLQSDWYAVNMFADINSFRHYMKQHLPDVIILDIMLPDGNGLDECKDLKANNTTGKIPVILMSANTTSGTKEAGAATFINKPFDINEFRYTVERHLVS